MENSAPTRGGKESKSTGARSIKNGISRGSIHEDENDKENSAPTRGGKDADSARAYGLATRKQRTTGNGKLRAYARGERDELMKKYEMCGFEFTADDIINADDRECYSRAFIVSETCGFFAVVRSIVFADSVESALDETVDAGKLKPIPSEDFEDYGIETDEPRCAFLGNAGEPFDIDNVNINEIDINAQGFRDALAELDSRRTYEIRNGFGRTGRNATVSEKPVYLAKATSHTVLYRKDRRQDNAPSNATHSRRPTKATLRHPWLHNNSLSSGPSNIGRPQITHRDRDMATYRL